MEIPVSEITPVKTPQERRFWNIPTAIFLAGLCISVATYFGLKHGVSTNAVAGAKVAAPQIRPVDDTDHIRGKKDAPITVVEYSDLECPYCKQFHNTLKQLVNTYPDKVRWVYRHYPIPQLHQKAVAEALATECAAEQGKFWEMTDAIFEQTPSNDRLDLAQIPAIAKKAGVADENKFLSCLQEERYMDAIKEDNADALMAGGSGTPHTIILGSDEEVIPLVGAQPYQDVETIVKQLF